ncbi:MAG: hypothetical protein KKE20_05695 [Nanoarchaeota archaeon]|nr:hypothetical protein [Nanoarchaeota archaeon]
MNILTLVTHITVILASVFSLLVLFRIKSIDNITLRNYMSLMCSGIILFTSAEILFWVFKEAFPSYADIPYVAGTLVFLAGSYHIYSKQDKISLSIKEIILLIGVLTGIAAFLFWMIYYIIIPSAGEDGLLTSVLNFFYPLGSAAIFLISYLYQTHSGKNHGPIYYIMSSFFFIFVGDIMFSYTSWTGNYGRLGYAHDTIYLIGYIFMLIGVSLAYFMMRNTKQSQRIKQKVS